MKNPQFLSIWPEIQAILPTHELVIFTKIVDFLLVTWGLGHFFFLTVSRKDKKLSIKTNGTI